MSKWKKRKMLRKLRKTEEPERKKGEPIFGNTPYGSKGGVPNVCGFAPPRPRWDKPEDDDED